MSMADDYRNEYSKEDDDYYVNHIKRSSNMQVTGTISSVVPRIDNNTNTQRYWLAHGKTFYVYDMTVNGPQGALSGEINSTTANVYPKTIGEQIVVEHTVGDYGGKLKAISQQNQQGGQAPQQQAPPQQQTSYTPPSQAPPQNDIQARIMFGQAINCTKDELIAGKIKDCQVERRARMWENILKTQQFPSYMREQAEVPQQQAPPQQPASQFTPENNLAPAPQQPDLPPFSAVDDIPF